MTTDQMVIELKSVTFDLISLLERETEGKNLPCRCNMNSWCWNYASGPKT